MGYCYRNVSRNMKLDENTNNLNDTLTEALYNFIGKRCKCEFAINDRLEEKERNFGKCK